MLQADVIVWYSEAVRNQSRKSPKAHTCKQNANPPFLRGGDVHQRNSHALCESIQPLAVHMIQPVVRHRPNRYLQISTLYEKQEHVIAVHGFDCGSMRGMELRMHHCFAKEK